MSGKGNLTFVDRQLLKILLSPDGRFSSKEMAKKLGIPETTVQRHKRRLERDFIILAYTLDLAKFGWHRVDFFVATERGMTDKAASEIMKYGEVVFVGKSIGEHSIDLHVQAVLKGNAEILQMLERLKGLEGIKEVIWSEIIEVVGRKQSIPSRIIDVL